LTVLNIIDELTTADPYRYQSSTHWWSSILWMTHLVMILIDIDPRLIAVLDIMDELTTADPYRYRSSNHRWSSILWMTHLVMILIDIDPRLIGSPQYYG
jgi:hypothetical protein